MKKYSLGALLLASIVSVVASSVVTYLYAKMIALDGVTTNMNFGVRMTQEDGVSVFCIDEIQERLEEGAVITSLKSNGASFIKTGENDDAVSMYFSGGSFEIELKGNTNSIAPNAR